MINEITQETFDSGVQLSDEEIAIRKQGMLDFYKEQIDFMNVQLEFEKLSADIEENRLRRLVAMVRQAQIQSPPDESDPNSESQPTEKKRSLKKS